MVQPSILKSHMIEIHFYRLWLQNHCWLSLISMTPKFVSAVSVLLTMCCPIGSGTLYLCIFVE